MTDVWGLAREPLLALPSGQEVIEHVEDLERCYLEREHRVTIDPQSSEGAPDRGASPDFDVLLAGGGLALVYGAYLARKGLRVAIFDRRRIGCGHREWNISRGELEPLVRSGLFSQEQVEELLLLQYDHGVVRWHGGGTHAVRHVLDCVIDAASLLTRLRGLASAAGATLLDHHALEGYAVGTGGVRVDLDHQGARVSLTGRVLVDGLGAASPHARFDLVCPTVGGVLLDLDEGEGPRQMNPRVGEILASTEDVEEGRQHIWEGFPAPGGRYTTYLFYYDEPASLGPQPLAALYERFFRTLGRYKTGAARLEKATYGFIPAYSRLREMPAARDRVLLVGDAAARHSPLTFCGFGSMIRSFLQVADGLAECLERDRLSRRHLERLWREPPSLKVMGGLTLMMIPTRNQSARGPAEINRLLDAAFSTLAEMGDETYAAFVRDEIGFSDFMRFMQRTAKKRPTIYDEVFAHLSRGEIARWSMNLVRLGLGA